MDVVGWSAVLLSLVLSGLAWWRTISLRKEVHRLTRNEYYRDGRLREITGDSQRALETVRIQLACLAMGQPVDAALIRSGRLYQEMTAEVMENFLATAHPDKVFILDVRTPREYAVKHLPSAKSIPLEELEARSAQELPKEVSAVIVYCASGERSQLACEFLSRHGWTSVHHLTGGMQQWTGPTEGMGTLQLVQIQSRSQVHR